MNWMTVLFGWQLNDGASDDAVQRATTSVGMSLPSDYIDFIRTHDGGEGFVGDNYLIVWSVEELVQFNREYETDVYLRGLLLFASDGGGEAYGFDLREEAKPVVAVPFIGMGLDGLTPAARNFGDLVAPPSANVTTATTRKDREVRRGMELFEIKPVILGGDPYDSTNKTWLSRQQHFEVVRYWNRIVRDLRQPVRL